jgi:hypothetical protein
VVANFESCRDGKPILTRLNARAVGACTGTTMTTSVETIGDDVVSGPLSLLFPLLLSLVRTFYLRSPLISHLSVLLTSGLSLRLLSPSCYVCPCRVLKRATRHRSHQRTRQFRLVDIPSRIQKEVQMHPAGVHESAFGESHWTGYITY